MRNHTNHHTERNWSLSEYGGSIADVSHEARHAASGAENLLICDDERMWIAGDVPQHVTLRVTTQRPPIQYAGWNVLHDYLTNPKVVEILSGETLDQLQPVTVCRAIPGPGCQVWRLPRPIPAAHQYVRLRLLETFGAGPAYMHNVLLLSSPPDNRYRTYHPPPVTTPTTTMTPMNAPVSSSSLYYSASSPATVYSTAGAGEVQTSMMGYNDSQPYQHNNNNNNNSNNHHNAAAAHSNSSTFMISDAARGGAETEGQEGGPRGSSEGPPSWPSPKQPPQPSSSGRGGSSSMRQLLKDLDEDIRLLKPIHSITPKKNLIFSMSPPDTSIPLLTMPPGGGGGRRSGHLGDEGDDGLDQDEDEACGSSSGSSSGSLSTHSTETGSPGCVECAADHHHHHGRFSLSPSPSPHDEAAQRIASLEKIIATLQQTVQHQREDIALLKRYVMQEALHQRHAAADREAAFYGKEEGSRLEKAVDGQLAVQRGQQEVLHGLQSKLEALSHQFSGLAAAQQSLSKATESVAATRVEDEARHKKRWDSLVHRLEKAEKQLREPLTVDFPEAALRTFVADSTAALWEKHSHKMEKRLVHRLDRYLLDMVGTITNTVEERLLLMAAPTTTTSAAAALEEPTTTPTSCAIPQPKASPSSVMTVTGGSSENSASAVAAILEKLLLSSPSSAAAPAATTNNMNTIASSASRPEGSPSPAATAGSPSPTTVYHYHHLSPPVADVTGVHSGIPAGLVRTPSKATVGLPSHAEGAAAKTCDDPRTIAAGPPPAPLPATTATHPFSMPTRQERAATGTTGGAAANPTLLFGFPSPLGYPAGFSGAAADPTTAAAVNHTAPVTPPSCATAGFPLFSWMNFPSSGASTPQQPPPPPPPSASSPLPPSPSSSQQQQQQQQQQQGMGSAWLYSPALSIVKEGSSDGLSASASRAAA